jgi:hypothetical protein
MSTRFPQINTIEKAHFLNNVLKYRIKTIQFTVQTTQLIYPQIFDKRLSLYLVLPSLSELTANTTTLLIIL